MADTKITGLTELETPAAADLAVVVDDVAGAATTKKITLTNLLTFSPVATAAGDILYASSANTLARLAKGTAYQSPQMNSGATALEYVDGMTTWAAYHDTSTIVGWSSYTTKLIYTKKLGKTVFVAFDLQGTSDNTAVTFTVPYTSSNTVDVFFFVSTSDNGGATDTGRSDIDKNSATVTVFSTEAGGAWTDSGTKTAAGFLVYETT